MAEASSCFECKRKKEGRFTRRRQIGAAQTGTKWVPPSRREQSFPYWYCYDCLPAGQGRDETEETVATVATTKAKRAEDMVPIGRATPELTKAKGELTRLVPTISLEVQELTITDPEGYAYADSLLSRIREARKSWGGLWTRIQERTIKPIKEGLDALYSMNREADRPLELLENTVKAKMKAFKELELQQVRDAERAKSQEEERLRKEAEEKERLAAQAKTAQMRGKLQAQAVKLTERAEQVSQQETPQPTAAHASSTRTKKVWTIHDMRKFCAGIGDGTLPEDCITINSKAMNGYFKDDPVGMEAWPGVKVIDDIQIVGR